MPNRETVALEGPVFVGLSDIANNVTTMADALRQAGVEVGTLLIRTNDRTFYAGSREHDSVPYWTGGWGNRLRFHFELARRFVGVVRRYRTFVYIWHFSFLPKQLDFVVLRLLRRRVLVFYCGDDVRYRPTQIEIDRLVSDPRPSPSEDPDERRRYCEEGRGFRQTLWSLKIAEKTRCRVVAGRDWATFQGTEHVHFRFPQPQLTDGPREPSDEPLILHAPSARLLKGTRHVEEAVRRLREEGLRFRFELLDGAPNERVIELLREADIVIDQPGVWVGRFGAEALAASCVVVGGNQPNRWSAWPPDSPVVQFHPDPDRLAATLRELLSDRERRAELMRRGWEFWRDNYSYEAFQRFVAGAFNGGAPRIAPLPCQRELALRHAETPARRLALRLFW